MGNRQLWRCRWATGSSERCRHPDSNSCQSLPLTAVFAVVSARAPSAAEIHAIRGPVHPRRPAKRLRRANVPTLDVDGGTGGGSLAQTPCYALLASAPSVAGHRRRQYSNWLGPPTRDRCGRYMWGRPTYRATTGVMPAALRQSGFRRVGFGLRVLARSRRLDLRQRRCSGRGGRGTKDVAGVSVDMGG